MDHWPKLTWWRVIWWRFLAFCAFRIGEVAERRLEVELGYVDAARYYGAGWEITAENIIHAASTREKQAKLRCYTAFEQNATRLLRWKKVVTRIHTGDKT